jgi:hypothetical protein
VSVAAVERPGRTAGLAALAYVVLLLLGVLLLGTPEGDAPDEEWRQHFADKANRTQILLAGGAVVLAGASFLVAGTALARRLAGSSTSGLLGSAATAHGVLVMLAGLAGASMALLRDVAGMPLSEDVTLLRLSDAMFFATLLLPGLVTAGLVAWCVARSAEDVLPGWLRRSGYGVAVLSLAGLLLFPVVVWVLWLVLLAIVLLRG